MKNPVWPSSCATPAGTSNELDVQNNWEENTHTRVGRPVLMFLRLPSPSALLQHPLQLGLLARG